MRTMYVKPAPGRRVVDPTTTKPLGDVPLLVERTGFWLRRLKDGDVVECPTPATSTPAVAPAKEEA